MNNLSFFCYLLVIAGSTYLIRALPFALISKKIKNRFVQSFLAYIPCAVLTAMTIPAAFYATESFLSATLGLLVAVLLAWRKQSLTVVAMAACAVVFVVEICLRFVV